jgi:hypothetical protein
MANTYVSYTQTTPTNNLKYTISFWFKKAQPKISGTQYYMSAVVSGYANYWFIRTENNLDNLDINNIASSGTGGRLITNRKFRDPSAWYHVVYVYDSANVTAGDRMKLYVNGVEETSFATDTNPTLNQASVPNSNSQVLDIGREGTTPTAYFDGCMSHVQFVDGLALAPTEFGEFDSTSGIWKIKTGSYATPGNNGFHLKMEDASNLDLDSSSNAHTFTTTGTLTATKDNPSNNFATMNPLCKGDNAYSNGNLTIQTDSNNWHSGVSSLCVGGGKWYAEYKWNATGGTNFGIADARRINLWGEGEMGYLPTGAVGDSVGWHGGGSDVKKNGSSYYTADTYSAGDIISVALDCDNGAVYFRKNGGSWQNSGDPTSGATRTGAVPITTGETYFFGATTWTSGCNISANFGCGYFGTTAVASTNADDAGVGSFEYDVPAGYYALCTKNIKAYGG